MSGAVSSWILLPDALTQKLPLGGTSELRLSSSHLVLLYGTVYVVVSMVASC